MKPILLIYPPYEGKSYLSSRPPFPVGLLQIAAYLESKGIPARVLDMCYPSKKVKVERPKAMIVKQPWYFRFGWSDDEIVHWFKHNLNKYHDVIGVSSLMSSTYNGGYRVIDILKKYFPKKIIVVGGPHATAFPDHIAKNTKADYVCLGEGEELFYNFIKTGKCGVGLYQRMKKLPEDRQTIFMNDLNSLPFPKRELLLDDRTIDSMYVVFSRGCPHRCSFCGSHLIQGRVWRHKTPERVIEEMKFYKKHWGANYFTIEDDNLSPARQGIDWLKDVCRKVIKNKFFKDTKLHVSHGIPVYALADKELCDLMWSARFKKMVFPLESSDPAVLRDMRKTYTVKHWSQAVDNWTYESHHPTEIILGYPFVDTIDTMLETIKTISKKKCCAWASHFRLNKGTDLFNRCVEAKMIDPETYDPINTQSFFLETPRFTLNDLRELSQVCRGMNFGTAEGFDVFSTKVEKARFGNSYRFVEKPSKKGDIVARGSFGFSKGQTIFTKILLCRLGLPVPKLAISKDKSKIIYAGADNKDSRVFKKIKRMYSSDWSW